MSSGRGVAANYMLGATVFRLNSLPISSRFEISHYIGMKCDIVVLWSTQLV